MEMKLELVILPVTDVDRAKAYYAEQLGFAVDVDHQASESFRVVQLTPPGSACSVAVGVGITDADPGSVRGLHLVVTDIVAVRDELVARGADVGEVRHMGAAGWEEGPHPDRADYNSFAQLTDPDGNTWLLQEWGHQGT
jgi:catechol 2,3-dioxygenase-like lactoylglutathione lyase family enzyme